MPDVADVVNEMFSRATVPLDVSVDTTAPLVIDAAKIGHASLLSSSLQDLDLVRGRHQTQEVVAFAIQRRALAWVDDGDTQRCLMPGTLFMTDQSAPYRFSSRGANAAYSIEMDYRDLGVPVAVARKAAPRIASSPLYGLVTAHLIALFRDLDRIEALLPMILAYARQHLREPDLTPHRIARHHNISLRYLYKLCANSDIRVMDWIMQQRLEGAQEHLSRPDRNAPTIAAIAYYWGFKDARHFSARFRQRFGCSPREWRASTTTAR